MPGGADAAQSFYSRWARLYDLLARRGPGVPTLRERLADAAAPAPGDVVVEVGCGTGANLPYLRERVGPGGTVVGVDFSPGVLAVARRRTADCGNVHVVRGAAEAPPVAPPDRLVASFVVGMLPDPAAAVREWTDLVRPGGRIALLDLARSTRLAARPLNLAFRALTRLSSPPGTRRRRDSPTRTLDRRVAAAHRALLATADVRVRETRALGFARLTAGRVRADRAGERAG
ncbi:MAG: class I SAM-dependent methyltransferase [Haloferacaceae archaeon]